MKTFLIAVVWFCLAALAALYFLAPEKLPHWRLPTTSAVSNSPVKPAPQAIAATDQDCAGRPLAHGQHLIAFNTTPDATVSLASELAFPVVALFMNAQGDEVGAVSVYPGKTIHTRMISGELTLVILGGRQWCDLETGFLDGFEKEAPRSISLRPGDMKGVRLSALGHNAQDIVFTFRNGMEGNGRVEGSGHLALQPVAGGHFAVEGSINHKPITFMLDTGASTVSISRDFAVHAGIDTANCRKQQYQTANGVITACNTLARELTLGHFRMTNVEVSVQDNLSTGPLLGMNVIGRFRMEMRSGAMTLAAY